MRRRNLVGRTRLFPPGRHVRLGATRSAAPKPRGKARQRQAQDAQPQDQGTIWGRGLGLGQLGLQCRNTGLALALLGLHLLQALLELGQSLTGLLVMRRWGRCSKGAQQLGGLHLQLGPGAGRRRRLAGRFGAGRLETALDRPGLDGDRATGSGRRRGGRRRSTGQGLGWFSHDLRTLVGNRTRAQQLGRLGLRGTQSRTQGRRIVLHHSGLSCRGRLGHRLSRARRINEGRVLPGQTDRTTQTQLHVHQGLIHLDRATQPDRPNRAFALAL